MNPFMTKEFKNNPFGVNNQFDAAPKQNNPNIDPIGKGINPLEQNRAKLSKFLQNPFGVNTKSYYHKTDQENDDDAKALTWRQLRICFFIILWGSLAALITIFHEIARFSNMG